MEDVQDFYAENHKMPRKKNHRKPEEMGIYTILIDWKVLYCLFPPKWSSEAMWFQSKSWKEFLLMNWLPNFYGKAKEPG